MDQTAGKHEKAPWERMTKDIASMIIKREVKYAMNNEITYAMIPLPWAVEITRLLDGDLAHVLTMDEVEEYSGYLWLEHEGSDILEVELLHRGFIRNEGMAPISCYIHGFRNYGIGWRYWSEMPSDEIRRNTPWQE